MTRNNVTLPGTAQGQPMLFSHGFGCDQNIWRYVAPAFEPEYNVVLFDHVGSGGSDLSAYDSAKYASLGGYADDVLEICRELDLTRVVFVGHSVSAMIGVLAAIEDPERFEKLILVAPSPRYIDDRTYSGGFSRDDIEALLDSLDRNYLGWADHIAPMIVGNPSRPELAEELKDSLCRMDPAIARQFARVTFLSDNRDDLPKVKTRSLVLQASDDVIAPQQVGEYVHHELSDSQLVVMQAAGHCPHLSAPAETVGAIRAFASSAPPEAAATAPDDEYPAESAEDMYENAPCGYISARVDGTIVRVNRTFLTWTGYRRSDLVGRKRIRDLLPVGDRIHYETRYAPLLRLHGSAQELAADVVRADGERLPVLLSSVLVATPGLSPLVRTTVVDATDRLRYERELLRRRREAERLASELDEERQRLHQVLERLHEGVVTVDRELSVRFANQAARRTCGLEDLETSHPLPDPWPNLSLRQVAARLFAEDDEVQVDFSPTPSSSYSVVGLPAGPGDEAVLVFTDLSDISRREKAEREFVANAAHELRTPLTAITSAIDVLQAGAKEIAADRDVFLTDIEREAARLRRLTRGLLLLAEIQARKGAPPVAEVDVRGLLEDVAAGMQVNPRVAIEVNCDPALQVVTNADLAAQALESVAANAAKYTVSGRISLSASGDSGGATIVIADSGPGISRDARSRVFDRFYKDGERAADGFGLGLSIASQAVGSLGGGIEVQPSPPGGGTTVQIRLPTSP